MSAPQERSAPTSNEGCTHKSQSSSQEPQPTTAYRDDEHIAKQTGASLEGCAGAGKKGPPSPRGGTKPKPIQANNTNTNVQQTTSIAAKNVRMATSMLPSKSTDKGPHQEGSGGKQGQSPTRTSHRCRVPPQRFASNTTVIACEWKKSMDLVMIVLLLFLQKQNLANAIYLFGLGTLLSGLGLKHMRIRSQHDLAGTLVTPHS
jgi:hypothetical protein